MKKQILNIVNVIRAYEPRHPNRDLITPVKEQIRLMRENNLKGTFLLQYDALIDPQYTELLKKLPNKQFEFGIWYEIVEQLCDACNIKWTGRYSWDWHCHCAYPIGYPLKEREILIDSIFNQFKEIFGYYPKVFGAWLFDTHTLRYINDNYNTDAFCCCKEQYGTDGYTLWGGVYGQGYYPSKINWFIPAQNEEEKINIPMFRMLGSDPVYQYDYGLDIIKGAEPIQSVISLEPVYKKGGGDEKWTDWYLSENFSGDCLSFGYAQAGQENSFGWEAMKKGLTYQFPKFKELEENGKIEILTLGETGMYFKENFKETPPSVIYAKKAYDNKNIKSLWYSSKNYRINIYMEDEKVRIRDLYIYSDKIKDIYDKSVCEVNDAIYEALPVIDGNRFSGKGVICGAYPSAHGAEYKFSNAEYQEINNETARITFKGKAGNLIFTLTPQMIDVYSDCIDYFDFKYTDFECNCPKTEFRNKEIKFIYNDIEYTLTLLKGAARDSEVLFQENSVQIKIN